MRGGSTLPVCENFRGVSRHSKALLGGGVVTLIVFAYSLRYHSSWPLIIWVILLPCFLGAAFLRDGTRNRERNRRRVSGIARALLQVKFKGRLFLLAGWPPEFFRTL